MARAGVGIGVGDVGEAGAEAQLLPRRQGGGVTEPSTERRAKKSGATISRRLASISVVTSSGVAAGAGAETLEDAQSE